MKNGLNRLKSMERGILISIAVTAVCSVSIAAFLGFYFSAYQSTRQGELFDLSEGWQYETPHTERVSLENLSAGPPLKGGETLTLYRKLDVALTEAGFLVRANHQSFRAYLGDALLYAGPALAPGENPGIALHLIPLPEGYAGQTLKIELTSPYTVYSGRTSPILLGTVPALETYVRAESLRPLVVMALCFVVWVPIAVIGFLRGSGGAPQKEQLAAGVFAIGWALFFISAEYDILPFTPVQRSVFCLTMYFLTPVPLSLYFYFSFEHYKKWMLPVVLVHCAFAAAALGLQFFGVVDLPRIVSLNSIVLLGKLYGDVLAVLEARRKNRSMMLAVPFLLLACIFMFFYFFVSLTGRDLAMYHYRDFYFLLVLAILIYSIWHFFRDIYRQKKENEALSLQKRLMQDSYELYKMHLHEAASLKHDMKGHFAAMQAYLERGRIEEARDYLARYTGQSATVTEAVYSEHFLLNSIAGGLYQRAREQDVKVELKLAAAPEHIADPDFYNLLFNLTQNALEACVAVPEGRERFIRLAVTKRAPYLNIRCENSRGGGLVSEDGKIQTSKVGAGHGYGLQTIEHVVDAYDGMMNIEHDADTFTVTLALKDKEA